MQSVYKDFHAFTLNKCNENRTIKVLFKSRIVVVIKLVG